MDREPLADEVEADAVLAQVGGRWLERIGVFVLVAVSIVYVLFSPPPPISSSSQLQPMPGVDCRKEGGAEGGSDVAARGSGHHGRRRRFAFSLLAFASRVADATMTKRVQIRKKPKSSTNAPLSSSLLVAVFALPALASLSMLFRAGLAVLSLAGAYLLQVSISMPAA